MTVVDDLALVSGAGPEVLAAAMRLAKRAREEGLMEASTIGRDAERDVRRMAEIMDSGRASGFGRVLAVFDMMRIAEDVLEERGLTQARLESGISLFSVMRPTTGFSELLGSVSGFGSAVEEIYRFHCVELAERHAAGGKLAPATGAEIILGMLHASLSAPLRPVALAIMAELCRGVPSLYKFASAWHPYAGTGAVEEELATIRNRLRVEDRGA